MASITVTCPECDKQLKASSDLLGKKIRCKSCGATFVGRAPKGGGAAPASKAKPPAKPAAKPAAKEAPKPSTNDGDFNPYGVTEEYLGRLCPNCTEKLDEEQIICLNCGYNTTTRERARTRKVKHITGGDVFFHLLPGILCALAVIVLLTAMGMYIFMVNEAQFGDAWYFFIGGKGIKIWAGVIVAFTSTALGRFAFKRLVYNNRPDEVEDKSSGDEDEDDD